MFRNRLKREIRTKVRKNGALELKELIEQALKVKKRNAIVEDIKDRIHERQQLLGWGKKEIPMLTHE